MANSTKSLVHIIGTGGTIAGEGDSRIQANQYEAALRAADQLVAAIPEAGDIADIDSEQLINIASQDISVADWLALARSIEQRFNDAPRTAGIVVTHGTNSLEETAFFLNLVVSHTRPVVLVSAMRPATALSADGPLNLFNAIRVAASKEAVGKGVLVVMNNEISGGRDVTKTHTGRGNAFRACDYGVMGYVDDDAIEIYNASTKRHTTDSEFSVAGLAALPTVEIVYTYADQDPSVVDHFVNQGVAGIVLAGMGSGSVPEPVVERLNALHEPVGQSCPVVVHASRVGAGRVQRWSDDDERIRAEDLSPQKARILLALALTRTRDQADIQRIFGEY